MKKDTCFFWIYVYVCAIQIVIVLKREGEKSCIDQSDKMLCLSDSLIAWYLLNKRELPWRETADPYKIWVSEIILQQTRVAQGLDYFNRFIYRFPDVKSLALAEEDEVLKYWQGLGYYSRARNMRAAAKDILIRFNGVFPESYEDVLSLKGVGEYTAAAIVSFAWNLPYPVVDGNVYRVLARLFAIDVPIDTSKGKRLFYGLAREIMDLSRAGMHNQAIMELGALCCTPQSPICEQCPLKETCVSFATNTKTLYPVKQNKIKVRNRYFHYFYLVYNGRTWLHRRDGKDIWAGLYEFPMIETESEFDFVSLSKQDVFKVLLGDEGTMKVTPIALKIKHVLSHQILYASFYRVDLDRMPLSLNDYVSVFCQDLEDYAVPQLIHNQLGKLNAVSVSQNK